MPLRQQATAQRKIVSSCSVNVSYESNLQLKYNKVFQIWIVITIISSNNSNNSKDLQVVGVHHRFRMDL